MKVTEIRRIIKEEVVTHESMTMLSWELKNLDRGVEAIRRIMDRNSFNDNKEVLRYIHTIRQFMENIKA